MSYNYILECSICGKSFKAIRSDADFCSDACRQKNYRKNVKHKIIIDRKTIKALERKINILKLGDRNEMVLSVKR